MKNPLRYFLDEGFGHIVGFYTDDGERMDIRIRWAKGFNGFEPKVLANGMMTLNGVDYVVDRGFIDKYVTMVENEEEAVAFIKNEDAIWNEVCKHTASLNLTA
jgi:hypothetical protein